MHLLVDPQNSFIVFVDVGVSNVPVAMFLIVAFVAFELFRTAAAQRKHSRQRPRLYAGGEFGIRPPGH